MLGLSGPPSRASMGWYSTAPDAEARVLCLHRLHMASGWGVQGWLFRQRPAGGSGAIRGTTGFPLCQLFFVYNFGALHDGILASFRLEALTATAPTRPPPAA